MPGAFINKYIQQILIIILCGWAAAVLAQTDQIEQLNDGFDVPDEEIKEWQFREDFVDLPEYPKTSALIRLDHSVVNTSFEYFIDKKSLSIGADEVVRYTIVIQSSTGARNILFESIRCDSREYKTIAYGTTNKSFYKLDNPKWERITQRTGHSMDYRRDLVTVYFCSELRDTLDMAIIVQRLEDSSFIPEEAHSL